MASSAGQSLHSTGSSISSYRNLAGQEGDRRSKRQKADQVSLFAKTEEDIHNLVWGIPTEIVVGLSGDVCLLSFSRGCPGWVDNLCLISCSSSSTSSLLAAYTKKEDERWKHELRFKKSCLARLDCNVDDCPLLTMNKASPCFQPTRTIASCKTILKGQKYSCSIFLKHWYVLCLFVLFFVSSSNEQGAGRMKRVPGQAAAATGASVQML